MGRYHCPVCGGALSVEDTTSYSEPMRVCNDCGAEFLLDGDELHYLPDEDEADSDLKDLCKWCENILKYPDCKPACDKC